MFALKCIYYGKLINKKDLDKIVKTMVKRSINIWVIYVIQKRGIWCIPDGPRRSFKTLIIIRDLKF